MHSARYLGHRTVDVVESPVAEPGPGEVRVRVAYVGLCGTDLHIVHGHMDQRVTRPLTFGHELSGTIDSVGPEVADWSIGDPVTVMPLLWDGSCPACRDGNEHICHNLTFVGIDSPGALQQQWVIPVETLIPLPGDLALDTAALIEPVAVAVHDVRRSELASGDRAVVFGGGPIGLLIASVARQYGADVRVVEVDAKRRARIADLGFATVDPSTTDLVRAIEEWTDGAGADVVFEVSGAAAAVRDATTVAKVRGTVVVVAIHATPREVDLQRVFWRELRLLGARVYQRADFEEAIRLLQSSAIPVEAVITDVVALDEIPDAIADLESGRAMKVLVDVQRVGAER